MTKQELLATIRDRYRASSKKDKSRILDEFIAVTGHHRKAIASLHHLPDEAGVVVGGVTASGCLGNLTTMETRRIP